MVTWRSHAPQTIMLCASRFFPSWLQPGRMAPPWYKLMPIWGCKGIWSFMTKLIDGTCQPLLLVKWGSGNVVKVGNGPWLKNLRVACEVDWHSLPCTILCKQTKQWSLVTTVTIQCLENNGGCRRSTLTASSLARGINIPGTMGVRDSQFTLQCQLDDSIINGQMLGNETLEKFLKNL